MVILFCLIIIMFNVVPAVALEVPFYVCNWTNSTHNKFDVTGGLPLPQGEVQNVDQLSVRNSRGEIVPAQFGWLSKWWATDQSIKWLRIHLKTSIKPMSKQAFYLIIDKKERQKIEHKEVVKLKERNDHIEIDTGPMRCILSKTNGSIFKQAWIDLNGDKIFQKQEELLNGKGIEAILTLLPWPEVGLEGQVVKSSEDAPDSMEVIHNGPIEATIRVDGHFKARINGKTQNIYGYRIFVHAFAGESKLQLEYSLQNIDLGLGYAWPFGSLEIVSPFAEGPYQEANLYPQKEDRNFSKISYKLNQSEISWVQEKAKEFEILKAGLSIGKGKDSLGFINVYGGGKGYLLFMRDIAEQFPKSISVRPNQARIGLFPEIKNRVYWLDPGSQKTFRVVFDFYHGKKSDHEITDLNQLYDLPPKIVTNPEWYATTKAWDGGFAKIPMSKGEPQRLNKINQKDLSWNRYGFIPGFNGAGYHWNYTSCFAKFLLTQNPADFELAEIRTWFFNDLVPIHTPTNMEIKPLNELKIYGTTTDVTFPFPQRQIYFPSGLNWHTKSIPDSGHLAQYQLLEYYYLTGDLPTLDAIKAIGIKALSTVYSRVYGIWSWSRDHPNQKFDPDETSWTIHSYSPRYIGWPIFVLSQAYAISGNFNFAEGARIYAYSLRNEMRLSPIDFMSGSIKGIKDNMDNYTRDWIKKYLDKNPNTPLPASSNMAWFQIGIALEGLYKYWEETHDEEARDTLIGAALCALRHCAINNRGDYIGWGYTWADYWSEGKRHESGSFFSSPAQMLMGCGKAYLVSGLPELAKLIKDGVKAYNNKFDPIVLGCYQATLHPKDDDIPPSAIEDLTAINIGPGKVLLSWTAPGDDGKKGKAKEYQIKYSNLPIVEQVQGWPDFTPPLPTTKSEYLEKAENFKKRNGISFWQATNCKKEPPPSEAGAKEKFALSRLSPGKYYFVIRTWDHHNNVSQNSNVCVLNINY